MITLEPIEPADHGYRSFHWGDQPAHFLPWIGLLIRSLLNHLMPLNTPTTPDSHDRSGEPIGLVGGGGGAPFVALDEVLEPVEPEWATEPPTGVEVVELAGAGVGVAVIPGHLSTQDRLRWAAQLKREAEEWVRAVPAEVVLSARLMGARHRLRLIEGGIVEGGER